MGAMDANNSSAAHTLISDAGQHDQHTEMALDVVSGKENRKFLRP
jgi:hypothetical protein